MNIAFRAAEPVIPAGIRVSRSRNALRLALQEAPSSADKLRPQETASLAGWHLLKSKASTHFLKQGMQQIWTLHPWRIAGQNALQTADLVIKPIAQHSPIKLVVSAFVAGGLLSLARPWRLIPKSVLIAGLLGR